MVAVGAGFNPQALGHAFAHKVTASRASEPSRLTRARMRLRIGRLGTPPILRLDFEPKDRPLWWCACPLRD